MFFKQRATKLAPLSYLLGCAGQGKAAAVDVGAGYTGVAVTMGRSGLVLWWWGEDTHPRPNPA
jgi:hypothetical protein